MADKINTGEDDFDIMVSVSNVNGEMVEDEEMVKDVKLEDK